MDYFAGLDVSMAETHVCVVTRTGGLAVVFGVQLPRALSPAFIKQALQASDGIPGLSAAMRGLIGARAAVLAAIVAIDADIRRMVRSSDACRRLMSIPGVGQLTTLAFTAAVSDPFRFRRSRDIGAYLGLVPRRSPLGSSVRSPLRLRLLGYAGLNSVACRNMACMMMARRRASAIFALRIVDRLAIAKAQSLSFSGPL